VPTAVPGGQTGGVCASWANAGPEIATPPSSVVASSERFKELIITVVPFAIQDRLRGGPKPCWANPPQILRKG